MKIVAVIQARMNSSRLEGKILKKFSNNLNMIDMQLQTLKKIVPEKNIYIATTVNREDDIIEQKYKNICNIFRGDEKDVLSRFSNIIKNTGAKNIIRVASDNPFIFYEGINYLLEQHQKLKLDYTTFRIEEIPSMLVPNGLYVEIVSSKALLEIEKSATIVEKEHVTYVLYNRLKDYYNIALIDIAIYKKILNHKDFRFTVDTEEDFLFIDKIIKELNIKSFIDMEIINKIISYSYSQNFISEMRYESNKIKNSKQYEK